MRDKTGIYVHIPFCVQKCRYCDFLSFPSEREGVSRYVDSLLREIRSFRQPEVMAQDIRSFYLPEESAGCMDGSHKIEVDSVFIGGGTPSILPVEHLERIFGALSERFRLSEDAEITVECNPGTAGKEAFQAYRSIGINRISFGFQSAVDAELKKLGRIHTATEAEEAFWLARQAGFDNINIDLMSAIPGQTLDSYRMTLGTALALNPQHISAYSLIIEDGTPFYAEYGEKPPVDEDTDREMYAMTKDLLAQGGYRRFEISNYAK